MESPRAAKHLFFSFAVFHPLSSEIAAGALSFGPPTEPSRRRRANPPAGASSATHSSSSHLPPIRLRGRGAESPPGVGSAGDGVHISAFKGKNAGSERSPLSSIRRVRGISPPGGAAGPGFGCRSAQGWFWHSNLPPSPRPPGCSVPFDLASGSIQRQEEKMLLRGQSVF